MEKMKKIAVRDIVQWLEGYLDVVQYLDEVSEDQLLACERKMGEFIRLFAAVSKAEAIERENKRIQEEESSRFDEEDCLPF